MSSKGRAGAEQREEASERYSGCLGRTDRWAIKSLTEIRTKEKEEVSA